MIDLPTIKSKPPASTVDTTAEKYRQHYSDFIELAAHDLQSPLRKLEVLTEGLVNKYRSVEEEDAKQYLRRIRASIVQMRSLVQGLRELSMAIPEVMQFEPCDTGAMIRQIINESASQIREKEIGIGLSALPVIRGDREQLMLLFRKILDNAFKFKRKDIPLRVDITAGPLGPEEQERLGLKDAVYARFVFADNGIGFDESDRKRIFDPLIRLHGRTDFPGNGLGLAIVQKIVTNHKGIVYAEGSRSEGTRIVLIMPQTTPE